MSITWGPTASTTVTEVVVPRPRTSSAGYRKGSYFPWCEALPPTPTPGPGSPPTSPLPPPGRQPSTRRPRPRRSQRWLDPAGSSARPAERTAMDTPTSPRGRARPRPCRRIGVGGLCALPYEARADPQSTKQPDVRFTCCVTRPGDAIRWYAARRHTASCDAASGRAGHDSGGCCRQGPAPWAGSRTGGLASRGRTGCRGRSAPRGGPDDAQPRSPGHRRRADRRRSPITCTRRHSKHRTANRYAGNLC